MLGLRKRRRDAPPFNPADFPDRPITPPDEDPAVAVLYQPYRAGPGLARVPLDALIWPLGRPERLAGAGTVADLEPRDHLLVRVCKSAHLPMPGVRARLSALAIEPRVVHGYHMEILRWTWRGWFRIFTHDRRLLASVPNGIYQPGAMTWVPEWRELDLTKTRHASLIASAKRDHEGHRLRHEIAEFARAEGLDVDLLGWAYRPLESKAEGLAPYRFSVVIENSSEPGYFSEKLIDAFMCETVPIYWGAPDITEHFDPAGMVVCRSGDEIRAALRVLDASDYERIRPALLANKERCIRELHISYRRKAARRVFEEATGRPAP
ncbi:MAG: hypothetical protein D6832_01965 [Alphaproteobacteria bacterium]|nr:MAG: hypothetical protein D6832_01965 [Alphaproteobacteria bacterium]